jgi:hypothetical protein
MPVMAITAPADVALGDTWRLWLLVTDYTGVSATADAVAVTVSEPDGTDVAATVSEEQTGLYLVTHEVDQDGDHLAVLTVTSAEFGNDVESLAFVAVDPEDSTPPDPSDPTDVSNYLGSTTSATALDIIDAMEAELAAQRRVCRVPSPFPADLYQALKRRVARNLAARTVPIASFTAFEGGATSQRVPAKDAEVARLEAPFRKLPVA